MSRRLLQSADLGALSHSAPDLAQVFVSLSSDIALVIDRNGTVLDVAQDLQRPLMKQAQAWIGRQWVDTVTPETRSKIEQLLHDAGQPARARRREVNHLADLAGKAGEAAASTGHHAATETPVSYAAVRLGTGGRVLAVGRDLRLVAGVQQRFLQAQQALERAYWQERQAASRDWMLLHVATDAVMTMNPAHWQVQQCNAAALRLWPGTAAPGAQTLAGQALGRLFDSRSEAMVRQAVIGADQGQGPVAMKARLAGSHIAVELQVQALPARPHAAPAVLMRARCAAPSGALQGALNPTLQHGLAAMHEGVVVTDLRGRVLAANRSFARMTNQADETRLLNQPLQRFFIQAADPRGVADESPATELRALETAAMAEGLVHAHGLLSAETHAGSLHGRDGMPAVFGSEGVGGSPTESTTAVQVTVTRLLEAGQAVLGWVFRAHAGTGPGPGCVGSESEVGPGSKSEVGPGSEAFPRER